ncbi:Flp1 family type IVb pilin [Paenibacillus sp. TSA_86.1]|uniref:Flp1 family type IVb pilin n=1 Tax=Paenibacillus sp. TSA_86.1 TaxID=3415649 RepID=UPI0040467DA9
MIKVGEQMMEVREQTMEVVKNKAAAILKEEDGLGTLELILIIGVIIIIALIFKDQITRLITSLLSKVDTKSNEFFPGK